MWQSLIEQDSAGLDEVMKGLLTDEAADRNDSKTLTPGLLRLKRERRKRNATLVDLDPGRINIPIGLAHEIATEI